VALSSNYNLPLLQPLHWSLFQSIPWCHLSNVYVVDHDFCNLVHIQSEYNSVQYLFHLFTTKSCSDNVLPCLFLMVSKQENDGLCFSLSETNAIFFAFASSCSQCWAIKASLSLFTACFICFDTSLYSSECTDFFTFTFFWSIKSSVSYWIHLCSALPFVTPNIWWAESNLMCFIFSHLSPGVSSSDSEHRAENLFSTSTVTTGSPNQILALCLWVS